MCLDKLIYREKSVKKKNIYLFILVFLILTILFLSIWGKNPLKEENSKESNGSKIILASDLHYLSDKLTDHGQLFEKYIKNSDGKTMEYSEEVLDAFTYSIIKEKPDVLVLTGDLTYNGEKISHEDLSEKLKKIKNEGIKVLVIPGNHDLKMRNAIKFVGEGYEKVASVDREEFKKLYEDFGYKGEISYDSASMSYISSFKTTNQAGKEIEYRLLMLDVNGVEVEGFFPKSSLEWLEKELKNAEEDGAKVISFSHQNLLKHSMFERGYVINNADEILKLFDAYSVKVNFSGHLHIQHVKEENNLTEVTTSAMSIYPSRIAVIELDEANLNYSTDRVNMEEWARENNIKDENLLDFKKYAKDFFNQTSYNDGLRKAGDSQDKEKMAEYFRDLNIRYFTGEMKDFSFDEDLEEKWYEADMFFGLYIKSIKEEKLKNHTKADIKLD